MSYLCGVDIGGTFTDVVIVDAQGRVTLAKSASTPDDFSRGFFTALGEGAATLGLSLRALLADTTVKSFDIAVLTRKGEVQLSGFVDSQGQIDRALEVTRGVEGVASVGNEMSIKK